MLETNPFLTNRARPTVSVAGGEGPYDNVRRALARIDLAPASGRRVLLKPNAGRAAAPESGVTTHPDAVAAAIDAFREAGADIFVGESPIAGVDVLHAFETTGIADAARSRNCPLLDLDARPFAEVAIPDGLAIRSLRVCPDVLEADLVVSLPVAKMHMHTGVSLAVKNMKGCLWRRSKVALHMLPPVAGRPEKPIDIAIGDMASVLRPHLAVVDGYIGLEGLGPSAGSPRKLDAAAAGADPFAVDAVACALMGRDAGGIDHLRLAAERGLGTIDLAALDVAPDDWRGRTVPFALPPEDIAIDFPNVTIHDRNSCSACQSTLLLFLKRYGETVFDYFPPDTHLHFAIGKGHDALPPDAICIGNCTARCRPADSVFVPGCPPVASEILGRISGAEASDTADGEAVPDRDDS